VGFSKTFREFPSHAVHLCITVCGIALRINRVIPSIVVLSHSWNVCIWVSHTQRLWLQWNSAGTIPSVICICNESPWPLSLSFTTVLSYMPLKRLSLTAAIIIICLQHGLFVGWHLWWDNRKDYWHPSIIWILQPIFIFGMNRQSTHFLQSQSYCDKVSHHVEILIRTLQVNNIICIIQCYNRLKNIYEIENAYRMNV